jgi:uncharacterized protein YicC (UPF0701 family)
MAENDLEARVERLETAVTSIKVDLEVIKATMATKSDIANMATKSDIANMATKSDIANMATKSDTANMATKSDLVELRTEIERLKTAIADSRSSIILWVVSAVILSQLLPSLLKYFG